jgi:hypothetical protein
MCESILFCGPGDQCVYSVFVREGFPFGFYSASHSRIAPENIGLQKEQKRNIFACHTCNEVRLCFGNLQKGSWQHEKIR